MAGSAITVYEDRIDGNGEATLAFAGSSRTDDRGAYRVSGLATGQYVIRVALSETATNQQGLAYPPMYWPGTTQSDVAARVALGVGEERTNTDITVSLVATVHVTGVVLDATTTDTALRPGDVELQRIETNGIVAPVMTATVGGNRFHADGIYEGRYALEAKRPPSGPNEQPLRARTLLVVGVSHLDNVNLILQPSAAVQGRIVVDEHGQSPPDLGRVRVSLHQIAGSHTAGVLASRDGSFVLSDVPPGRYRLDANLTMPGTSPWLAKSISVEGHDIADSGIEVTRGQVVPDAVITLTDRLGGISGSLLDRNNRPATSYTVLAFPSDRALWSTLGRRIRAARPSDLGEFAIEALPPGDYGLTLLLDPEPNSWLQTRSLEALLPSAVRVAVSSGATTTKNFRVGQPQNLRH